MRSALRETGGGSAVYGPFCFSILHWMIAKDAGLSEFSPEIRGQVDMGSQWMMEAAMAEARAKNELAKRL